MRIQLEFSDAKVAELKLLMAKAGLKTYHDVFNNALTLMKWAVQETERGRVILSQDDRTNKSRELVMPFLDTVSHGHSRKSEEDINEPALNVG